MPGSESQAEESESASVWGREPSFGVGNRIGVKRSIENGTEAVAKPQDPGRPKWVLVDAGVRVVMVAERSSRFRSVGITSGRPVQPASVARAAGVGSAGRQPSSTETLKRPAQQKELSRPRKGAGLEGRKRPGCDGGSEPKRAERREAQTPSGSKRGFGLGRETDCLVMDGYSFFESVDCKTSIETRLWLRPAAR